MYSQHILITEGSIAIDELTASARNQHMKKNKNTGFLALKLVTLAVLIGVCPAGAWAETSVHVARLADLGLEQLSNITVTSFAGPAKSPSDTAASADDITAQYMRASSPMNLPSGGFLSLRKKLWFKDGSQDVDGFATLGNGPCHQLRASSCLKLRHQSEFDVVVSRVGYLPLPQVDGYAEVEARLVQNLFNLHPVEVDAFGVASQIERRIFIKAVWQP